MALKPRDKQHGFQITAGTIGRKKGHGFEQLLAESIKSIDPKSPSLYIPISNHIIVGNPASVILRYILQRNAISPLSKVKTWWLGGLATSGEGDKICDEKGNEITKSKSDVVVKIWSDNNELTFGISVKRCTKDTPTNDQLYFTTASAFCNLLRNNGILISQDAEIAMKMFCGDNGYRPMDGTVNLSLRKSDHERWFWEELPKNGREELEQIFTRCQRDITTILLQKAYPSDPYPPAYLLHQTKGCVDLNQCELAVFSMKELIDYSCHYCSFTTKPYRIRKGSHKGDPNEHSAPRFGFIQMQRGGQKQHPTQLQFNLQAGYFYKIGQTY